MFKFLKNLTQDKNECSHKYKEIGKYYEIDTDYDSSKRIVAVAVSECAICGEENHIECMRKHLTQDMTPHVQLKH